ncbi:MAG: diguanylate cyclase [Candidatus Omnitrophica bacterium]|nr:diguanylate cyclase [Candidatus Omnitrophota bacterium]
MEIETRRAVTGVGLPNELTNNIHQALNYEGYEFINFPSVQELLSQIKNYRISLIFVYNILPDLKDTNELCILLRSQQHLETVPIIIISHGEENREEKVKMLTSGLIDSYISSLATTEEIIAYAKVFLQRQQLEEELEQKNELLNRLSITDELTKLYNRRYLISRLDEELKKIKRYNYPLSCLMLDLDHFKAINDSIGHAKGDIVLEQLAELIKKNTRSIDIACRYGGDEIVIILSFTNLTGALEVAQRLRRKIEEHNFGTLDKPLKFSTSIGLVAVEPKDAIDVDLLLQALDKQLYEAKNTGRNKVCARMYRECFC